MQMQRRLQRRAVNALQHGHRPQHLLGGSGYFSVEEGRSKRDRTAAEPDVHRRRVLGRKSDGDDIRTCLDMPGLRVAAGRRTNSSGGDDVRHARLRRI